MRIEPVILRGQTVRLEPLTVEHVAALARVGLDPVLWRQQPAHRTSANTEAKLLLLRHAFETLAVMRVVLKTDALNEPQRRAIARLGAVEEGTFRKHLIAASGRARDMIDFSILDTEWPSVKARLRGFLARAHTDASSQPSASQNFSDRENRRGNGR